MGPDYEYYHGFEFGPIGYVLYSKKEALQYKILTLFIKYGIDITKEKVEEWNDYYSVHPISWDLWEFVQQQEYSNSHRNFILYLL